MQQEIPHSEPTDQSPQEDCEIIDRKNSALFTDSQALTFPTLEPDSAFQASSVKNPKPNEITSHLKRLLERYQDEQIQLGRDFHEVSQNLGGVAFLADVIARDLMKEQAPSAHQVKKIGSLIRNGVNDLRRLMSDRAPNLIDRHGLASALRELADRLSRTGKPCSLVIPEMTLVSNRCAEILLLEFAELAVDFLTERFRGATTRIDLRKEDEIVMLKIEIDGVCENLSLKLSQDLLMMRSLISIVGGSMEVGSNAGCAVYLIAVIPAANRNLK